MEMTFKRPANNRNIGFDEIAKEAKLPLNEVGESLTEDVIM